MKRLVVLVLAAGCAMAPGAGAASRTCHSGDTVYERDGVRVFEVGATDVTWFACGPRTRRPVELYAGNPAYSDLDILDHRGDKLLFEGDSTGEGGGERSTVGWFDARTSEARSGDLAGADRNAVLDPVIAPDGGVGAVVGIEQDQGVRIGYLASTRTRGALRGELVLSRAGGRYASGSLAFADGGRTLSWGLDDGRVRSVPVAGEAFTCTSGTTLTEGDGARVFEAFPPRRKTERGFQGDVLAACPRGATTPRELAVSDVYDQAHWDLESIARTGSRVAFVTGDAGVGLLDGGDVRFGLLKGIEFIQALALGSAGPPVLAGVRPPGGPAGQWFVARLSSETATSFGGWKALATQGGLLVSGSLAVGDDGRVTWRTKGGVSQSTPLAGETASDCTAGTTLISRDGLRVFEILPAGGHHARLLACPPGATATLPLLTGPRDTDWRTIELARENGRIVVFADGAIPAMISIGTRDARAGSPTASVYFATIRDVAAAADGRVAVALRSGRRWTITAFPLGRAGRFKRERTIARPRDGVRVGTLAFSADGARVRWRSRSGAARSAPLSRG